jgi:hypothetical protein
MLELRTRIGFFLQFLKESHIGEINDLEFPKVKKMNNNGDGYKR